MVKVKASSYLVFHFCGPAIAVAQTAYELRVWLDNKGIRV